MTARALSADQARRFLVSHHQLARPHGAGVPAVRSLLDRLRCIQLDPLDPIGTNADLVALARLDGISRDHVYDAVLPGHGFEHFAKERCLLPASAFPQYRDRAREVGWWQRSERAKRLDPAVVDDVLAEIRDRGPLTPSELSDRGKVEPLDWHGWKSTSKMSTFALELLWIRCDVVVCGRTAAGKRYDVPERALPAVAAAPPTEPFDRWALRERVEAAGWMPRAQGPVWGQLTDVRVALSDAMIAAGEVEEVGLPGTRRTWLAPAGFLDRPLEDEDDRMRILGPLDPLLWDRDLVRRVFGFDYVWEVYKPAATRRWGWYVCPLLHRGRLVGRIDARFVDGAIRVDQRWIEPDVAFDEAAYDRCLERHAAALAVGG
ncbi:MAG: crosslink repair DNA glycosylase YcaQ family protein [Myxococcota bacterium]